MEKQRLRFEYLDPNTVKDHPRNPRTHPGEQVKLMKALYADPEVGDAGVALVNERDEAHGWPEEERGLRMLDGHLRKGLKKESGEPIPSVIGRWTRAGEDKILATHDPMGLLARIEPDAYARLALSVPDLSELLKNAVHNFSSADLGREPDLRDVGDGPDLSGVGNGEGGFQGRIIKCPKCGHEWEGR